MSHKQGRKLNRQQIWKQSKFVFVTLIYGLILTVQSTSLHAQNPVISSDLKIRSKETLSLSIQDGMVYLRVNHTGLLNERTKKDLTSGLSTRAIILGQILDQSGAIVFQSLGTISAKYDLWEEKFYLTMYEEKYVLSDIEKIVEAFEQPKPLRLIQLTSLKKGQVYKVRNIETINPLDQEKFEAIQNWMIHQKSGTRGLGGGADGSVATSVPETAFKALFYSLWKKSKLGESLTGELRREIDSKPFTIEGLEIKYGAGK